MSDIHGTREELVAMIVNAKVIYDEKIERVVKLEKALEGLIDAFRNPHDGGEYEDGEVPALDAARKALSL